MKGFNIVTLLSITFFALSPARAMDYRIGDLTIQDEKSHASHTFSKESFSTLPRAMITTTTPWTPSTKFEGVSMKDVLAASGFTGKTLRVHALNDYWVDIPMKDVDSYNIILANKRDGVELKVRDFGPYFIVYPLDDNAEDLNKPIYYSRLVWQVDSITVMQK